MKYKLFFPVLLLVVVTIGSCKKDSVADSEAESFIRFKVDGREVKLQALSQSQLSYAAGAGLHMCLMMAAEQAAVSNKNVLTITINGTQSFAQNVNYDLVTPLQLNNGTTTTKGSIVYLDNTGAGFVAQGPQRVSATADMAAQVTITELAEKHLKGNFSAIAYHATDLSKKVAITEGEFFLKRVN